MSGVSEPVWARQWRTYPRNHAHRTNLLIHAVAVPAFVLGAAAVALGPWPVAIGGMAAVVVSLAAQGRGHALETEAPEAFTGPGQFVARLLTEQLVTFPRFFLGGGWLRAWRAAGRAGSEGDRGPGG